MYERFYGLAERPFELTPNPRFLLLTPAHREALNTLEYGISARKGITLLLGDAGTGKTTLVRKALAMRHRAPDNTNDLFVYINNPKMACKEFLQLLAGRFDLSEAAAASKAEFLRELEAFLQERHGRGLATVLLVDEAQSLSDDVLEELRLLANFETDTDKQLQLVLAGQPELAGRLNEPHLSQLKQRIAMRCRLAALTLRETGTYIAGRIRLAGGDAGRIFTRDAVIGVHMAARGIPRAINVICDNAMLAGFAADEQPIGRTSVDLVCRDLDVAVEPAAASVASISERRWRRP